MESVIKSALVIDDDEFVRSIVGRMLTRLGADVTTASDGHTARQELGSGRVFDLVVCDLKMPGVDGIELLRDFADLQGEAGLILISSTDARTLRAAEQIAQARQLNILGCLQKPVSSSELGQMVGQIGARRKRAQGQRFDVKTDPDTLRIAIEHEQIDVYMQPKIALASGQVAGAEALARWILPDGRVLGPGTFIGVAEQAKLLDPLTQLVIRQTLRAQQQWHREGFDIPVSINIPIESLEHLDLPERLDTELGMHGSAPDQVVLEITETGVMRELAHSLDVVTRLRLRGYRLSIDDFGTGYSSLEQLARFPFSELKIDRAFVDGASRDNSLRSIVESSIRLAKALKLKTCAEGVETAEDYTLMRDLGCDLVQGFYIAKPMPKLDLPRWASTYRSAPPAAR
jgi:EAL domain-containing protein (putative c-di-GMP-specific phosphodiesterase class I)